MRELNWPLEVQQVLMATLGDGKPPPNVDELLQRHPTLENIGFELRLLLRDYSGAADAFRANGSLGTVNEHWDPAYEGLRNSPAFKRILTSVDIPAYWRAHGFPPQCRALGADDFECDLPEMSP